MLKLREQAQLLFFSKGWVLPTEDLKGSSACCGDAVAYVCGSSFISCPLVLTCARMCILMYCTVEL